MHVCGTNASLLWLHQVRGNRHRPLLRKPLRRRVVHLSLCLAPGREMPGIGRRIRFITTTKTRRQLQQTTGCQPQHRQRNENDQREDGINTRIYFRVVGNEIHSKRINLKIGIERERSWSKCQHHAEQLLVPARERNQHVDLLLCQFVPRPLLHGKHLQSETSLHHTCL